MKCYRCHAPVTNERGVARGKRYPLGAEVVWLCLPCYLDVTSRRALKKMPPRERLKAEQGRLWNE